MSKFIVVMGVSGSGKTAIGQQLSRSLNLPFYDADDFHPSSNIEKMKNGQPLTDQDRFPWLQQLASNITKWKEKEGAILACSALKESYRQILAAKTDVQWIYLAAEFDVIYRRMEQREHFMKAEMLQSQFDTLEVPNYGFRVSSEGSIIEIVHEILSLLAQNEAK